ncbi:hypothetical protein [Virgibacillus sp. YIM 98842]|uniref:hypothetical protein n=1 Tax=Virgibacillus sp. YIM 98842 TaxID=2663533 RepID=UPI0013DAE9D3|nr:hypothetical protein [Virgibacillus sp. YIM 98842]
MRFILLIIAILFLAACGNTEESVDENDAEQDEAGVDFRNIDVQTEDLEVNVTGQASTDSNEFYYRVEEAGNVILEEARVSLEEAQTDWREFEIMLDLSEKYSNNNEEPPIILLYGKNSEGEMVNPNYIPIDL